jgi:hypothetical protein
MEYYDLFFIRHVYFQVSDILRLEAFLRCFPKINSVYTKASRIDEFQVYYRKSDFTKKYGFDITNEHLKKSNNVKIFLFKFKE